MAIWNICDVYMCISHIYTEFAVCVGAHWMQLYVHIDTHMCGLEARGYFLSFLRTSSFWKMLVFFGYFYEMGVSQLPENLPNKLWQVSPHLCLPRICIINMHLPAQVFCEQIQVLVLARQALFWLRSFSVTSFMSIYVSQCWLMIIFITFYSFKIKYIIFFFLLFLYCSSSIKYIIFIRVSWASN